jgi:hypothetical protein
LEGPLDFAFGAPVTRDSRKLGSRQPRCELHRLATAHSGNEAVMSAASLLRRHIHPLVRIVVIHLHAAALHHRHAALMIAVSTVVMFGLMYLNTWSIEHVLYSQTRTWMAVVMGATMAVVMMGFMWDMYERKRLNAAIMAVAFSRFHCRCALFAASRPSATSPT